jgi:CheY-like chemotaxis protein
VLAGGVAHDFNNLLVGILGNASLALESLPPLSGVRSILEDLLTAGERAAQLTHQMLAYSGKGRFVVELVDISELIRKTLSLIQASIPRTVQLELDLAAALPAVEIDVAQIQQLIMNLVINGAEAVPEGRPGVVIITARQQRVDEDYLRAARLSQSASPGQYVCLEVRDTGAGMDESTKARIFDPFFTTKFTGRGLGLATVLGIVRGHKGTIQVDSAPGKGSMFRILLPAASKALAPGASTAQRPTSDLAGAGAVLVVDDEQIVRQMAQLSLRRYGYTVLLAANGQEALEVFRKNENEIRLVLLDMTMPVMSGEDTFIELKKIRPDVQIVLSSGYNEADAVKRFEGRNLAGFIQKPYTTAALGAKVKSVLSKTADRLAAD